MKKKLSYIFLFFSAFLAYGQVTLLVSEVKDPKVNQRFNLTVLLEISGENMIQETPLRMPDLSKFEILGFASEQNTVVVDARRGDVINQIISQWVLTPKQAGKFKIGSVLVTVNGKIYKTEPFEINVRESERSSMADNNAFSDLYLNVEVKEKSVYPNQPTIAVLRAYSRDYGNFRKLGKIQYPQQKNVQIKPVSFAKDEIETNAGIASQILGVFMIFPSESGSVDLSPVSAAITVPGAEEKINSNRVRLNVKKLPEGKPEHFKNAVGKFEVEVTNKTTEPVEIDKPVNVSLKVSGKGNLGNLALPKMVDSEQYTFFPPKISSNTVASKDGLTGNIVADYVVIPKIAGVLDIQFEEFAFFNPDDKKYVDLGSKSLKLNVKTHEQVVDAKSTLEKVNDYTNTMLETVDTPVLKTEALKVKEKDKIDWQIVLANLLLLVGITGLFIYMRRKFTEKKPKETKIVKPITTIADTEKMLREEFSMPLEAQLVYLKKLAQEEDFSKFFEVYEELHLDTRKVVGTDSESQFKDFIAENKGLQTLDNYRKLSEQLKFEKYAPYHNREQFLEFSETISALYTEIRN